MEQDPLTYAIIGCAMKVHQKLGPGFQEVIYQRALGIELSKAGLDFSGETAQEIHYDGVLVGERRADFVVGSTVIVEIKATSNLEDIHIVQTKNYTVIFGYPRGLLINFGARSLQYKLIFNPRTKTTSQ